ncbi:MAG: SDR family NAD(P)-dependent oxidoreductase [Halobacteria archaeon]|nr:SDR family NAD(P)-dependent oxidoreductase [Halobacteria archaeon]
MSRKRSWDFSRDTAIVTGAAQGIGKATAERLGSDGASVVLADIQGDKVEKTADELRDDGIEAEPVECNVADVDDVDEMVDRAVERFGSVEILINNAGTGSIGSVENLSPDDWERVIDVNLNGQFYCIREVARVMKENDGGRIVNVSSMAGRNISYHGAANYTASKWGVIGLTKHAAADLSDYGIRVNTVCPGATLTPLIESVTTEEMREKTGKRIPLERWAEPENQADAIAYLVSEEASYITGSVLEVDGGGQLAAAANLDELG